jgi:phosphoribosyl-AMP cyclohydrolase
MLRTARSRPEADFFGGSPDIFGGSARMGRVSPTSEPLPDVDALLARLRFDDRGLVPVVVQEATRRDVLMLAWMDAEAVRRTAETGRATYWSRSRQEYWVKGETSGNTQQVRDIRPDCDGDALLLLVDQHGPACHTGAASCFDVEVASRPG